ncbi:hypothetical protein GPALN_005045 [Globodera pallida]|nr:hypothetical protein GPALN_005045 [Globodera pallida]
MAECKSESNRLSSENRPEENAGIAVNDKCEEWTVSDEGGHWFQRKFTLFCPYVNGSSSGGFSALLADLICKGQKQFYRKRAPLMRW